MQTALSPKCPLQVLVAMGLAFAVAEAPADDIFWSNPAGGVFQNGINWSGGNPPNSNDAAFFNLSSINGYTVTFVIDDETQRMVVRNDVVTLDLAGNTYTLNGLNPTSFVVGQSGGDDGFLTLVNGELITVSTAIGSGNSGVGFVVASGPGASWNNSEMLFVGKGGQGWLTIVNGATVSAIGPTILGDAQQARGNINVTGFGSQMITSDDLMIGNEGIGQIVVSSNGSLVSQSDATLGVSSSSIGSATVTGLNTTWSNAGDLIVGQEGVGFISAVAGAQIITMQDSVFGAENGSVGIGTLSGNGSVWNSEGQFIVGNAGQGTLTVSGDASFFGTGPMVIGGTPDGVGEIQVIGAGSRLHVNDVNGLTVGDAGIGSALLAQGATCHSCSFVKIGAMPGSVGSFIVIDPETELIVAGDIDVGVNGDGSLLVANGGSVLTGCEISVGKDTGSTGQLTVTGAGSTISTGGVVRVWSAGDAAVTVADGGQIFSNEASVVGVGSGKTAQALVTGTGSSWISDSTFVVGTGGSGSVFVQNGGAVSSLSVTIVGNQGGVGEITVTGPGSSWTVANHAFVIGAFESFGRLTITDGATAFADLETSIGDGSNAMGEVSVSGSGSNLTIQVRLDIGNTKTSQGVLSVTEQATVLIDGFAIIGASGGGALEIASGGVFSTTAQTVAAGQPDTTADISVLNAGSSLQVGGFFEVGRRGQCVMTVADEGVVNVDGSSVIAVDASAVAEVIVTGSGSTWVSADELLVGGSGQATLLVKDNGVVSAPSVVIGTNGLVTGDSVLDGPVQNGGEVSPGVDNCSPAVLTVNGSYAQDSVGGLIIELGGTVPGREYDVLAISGDSILDGTLVLSLFDGFLPQAGQQFVILTANSVSGTFPQIVMPNSGQYEVSYESDSVTITVTQSAILGDFNGDGAVGAVDLLILLANWGPCDDCDDCDDCPADLDNDCTVGGGDLLILLVNWG